MNVLLTGISGFAGSHLAEYILAHTDATIYGIVQSSGSRTAAGLLEHPHARERIIVCRGDILNDTFLRDTVQQAQPDLVFHLAAQASIGTSWQDPQPTYRTNIFGQLALLEAVRLSGVQPRTLIIGSADEYGTVQPHELPVNEQTPLRPGSPYAVSKVTQDMMAYQYWAAHKLPVVRVRAFNHIGPRQTDAFVVASFARQVAEIEHDLKPPVVRTGNLDARRDFTDVRDMVRAYWLAAVQGEAGQVYNIGSGTARSIRSVLDALISMSNRTISIEPDPARMRPSDIPELRCDASRFTAQTGWMPEIPFEQTLCDVLNYWRATVAAQKKAEDTHS